MHPLFTRSSRFTVITYIFDWASLHSINFGLHKTYHSNPCSDLTPGLSGRAWMDCSMESIRHLWIYMVCMVLPSPDWGRCIRLYEDDRPSAAIQICCGRSTNIWLNFQTSPWSWADRSESLDLTHSLGIPMFQSPCNLHSRRLMESNWQLHSVLGFDAACLSLVYTEIRKPSWWSQVCQNTQACHTVGPGSCAPISIKLLSWSWPRFHQL